ncbi:MAG: DUF2798 domain-containing protein [Lachnospiraceae bacterium]|nr:DUF2798 domain-containing protein [Lachnospiraceae bacterium]
MPKSKFEQIIFTLCMVLVMVYGMVCYNVVLNTHVFNNSVFFAALHELPIMVPIAFILEALLVGRFAFHKASQLVDPKTSHPFHFVIAISVVTVICMCPLMSFAATLLFQREAVAANGFLGTWLKTIALNFPMALCYQLFYAGPFVRFLFSERNPLVRFLKKAN